MKIDRDLNYIFIELRDRVKYSGLMSRGRLIEFNKEYIDENIVENIYRGRVVKILPTIDAAFVDIGLDKNAYLSLKDSLPIDDLYGKEDLSIDQVLSQGEDIIVQVRKEGSDLKGPKISRHLEIAGRYMILLPFSNRVNVSKKIKSPGEIGRLRKLGYRIMKDNIGMIIRTNSEGLSEGDLAEEYEELIEKYYFIEGQKNFLPSPKLIYKNYDLSQALIRDNRLEEVNKIILNDKDLIDEIKTMSIYDKIKDRMILNLDEDFSIDYRDNISFELKKASKTRVDLLSGGYLVVDEVEAFTAIDVNSGGFYQARDLEENVFKINMESIDEIYIQIRLRNLSGIILIDFIDMKDQNHIDCVMEKLEAIMGEDKQKINILGMTKLGLVEMTRKKTSGSLREKYGTRCSFCGGLGNIIKIIDK